MTIKIRQSYTSRLGARLTPKTTMMKAALAVAYGVMMSAPVWAQSSSNTSITVDCTEVTVDYENDEDLTAEEQIQRMDDALDRSLSQYDDCQQGMSGGSGGGDETMSAEGDEAGGDGEDEAENEGSGDGEDEAENEGSGDGQEKADSESDGQEKADSESDGKEKADSETDGQDGAQQKTATKEQSEPSNSMSGGGAQSKTPKQKKSSLGAFDEWVKKNAQSSRSSGMQGTEPIDPSVWTKTDKDNNPTTGGYGAPVDADEKTNTLPPGQTQPPFNGKAPPDIPAGDSDSVLEQQIRKAAENEPDPVKRQQLWNEYRRYKGLPPVKIDSGT